MKKLILCGVVAGGLAAAAIGFAHHQFSRFEAQPIVLRGGAEKVLHIARGTTPSQLGDLLVKHGVIQADQRNLLEYYLKFNSELRQFRAGDYDLSRAKSVGDLLQHLHSGKEFQLRLALIEGRTFKNWRKAWQNADELTQTLEGKSEAEIAKLLDLPTEKVEGWLAPSTYNYAPQATDLSVLKIAAKIQRNNLNAAWENRAPNLPLKSPYEMLILASIVEKETGLADERKKVASVFINRLRKSMRLQTDPTVIYGMGDRYNGNITKKDLRTPTPYNTYTIDGLPPTPIAMPSKASLEAVSQPDSTPYYYFVANGTGGHTFSETLEQHNQAVARYLDWLKTQKNEAQ